MYNRQILVEHFQGKRSADDPAVKREFELLRKQAEIDYDAMYAGKRPREQTVNEIEEDYIYNAQLTAKTQRTLSKIKYLVLLVLVAIAVLAYVLWR